MSKRLPSSSHAQEQDLASTPASGTATITRRSFLRRATVATAAASLGTTVPGIALAQTAPGTRVAIIGAGLAGLNAAYRLRQAGITATVYEARNRVGGRTHSIRTASGLVYDLGGSFINTDHSDMRGLASELGLTLFDRNNEASTTKLPTTAYYVTGRDVDEATFAADFRPLRDQITADARRVFNQWDVFAAQYDQLSVTQYLNQHASKIPAAYVRVLVENAIRTEYGVEPGESSALQLLFLTPSVTGRSADLLAYSDERYTVNGGSQRIAEELVKRLPGQVQLNRPLSRVRRTGNAYTLDFTGAASVEADWVIVTVPASLLRSITFPTTLPAAFRDYLANVNLGRNEKVFAGFNTRAWRTSGEFSLGAWTDLGYSSVWDGTQAQIDRPDAALTLYYGGAEVARMPNGKSQYDAAVASLNTYIPGLQAAANGQYQRTNWTGEKYSKGAYVNFRPGQLTKWGSYFWTETGGGNPTQEVVFDGLVFAGEHTSDDWYGFMNGAAQTGRLAATAVRNRINAR